MRVKRPLVRAYTMGLIMGILLGFSVAMVLVGDSPWSDFWIDIARCCDRG